MYSLLLGGRVWLYAGGWLAGTVADWLAGFFLIACLVCLSAGRSALYSEERGPLHSLKDEGVGKPARERGGDGWKSGW